MSIEAMKQALEAAEVLEKLFRQAEAMHKGSLPSMNLDCQITTEDLRKGLYAAATLRTAIEAAEKQSVERGEPVAWVVEDEHGERLEWAGDAHSCHGLPTFPLYTTSPTYDQGWKDGYKHGAWANTAAPVQEPDLTEIPMIMTCTKCGAFGEAMLTLETQPAQKPVNVTSKMVQAFLYAAGRHFPWGGSDPAIEDGIKAALEAMPTPPAAQRQWVSLTDEEMRELEKQFEAERVRTSDEEYLVIYPAAYWQWQRAIEAKLREKNGASQ